MGCLHHRWSCSVVSWSRRPEVVNAALADRPPHAVAAYQEMFEAVVAGATDPEIESVEVVRRPALTVSPVEMLEADGYLLGSPANLGYISGALKHAFDCAYYQLLDSTRGRPFGAVPPRQRGHRGRRARCRGHHDRARLGAGAETVVVIGQAEQERRRGVLEPRRDGRRSVDAVSRADLVARRAYELSTLRERSAARAIVTAWLFHQNRAIPGFGFCAIA